MFSDDFHWTQIAPLINNTYRLMYGAKVQFLWLSTTSERGRVSPNSNTGRKSLTAVIEAQTQIKYCNPKKLAIRAELQLRMLDAKYE